MISEPKLLFPTRPAVSEESSGIDSALKVANRVLAENGMHDFSTAKECAAEWNGYFLFAYIDTNDPGIRYGGGATLVVRQSDNLGGMVYCSFDWLEEDRDGFYANIPRAFSNYDLEHSHRKQ